VLAHSLAPEPKVTTPAALADAVGHPPLVLVLSVPPPPSYHPAGVALSYFISNFLVSNQ